MAKKRKVNPIKTLSGERKKSSFAGKAFSLFFLAVVIPLVIIILIEIVLRFAGYGKEWPLFTETRLHGRDYITLNPDYSQKYFLNESFTFPHYDLFLKDKPQNALRIFVLGSSTVYGFPYHQGISFPSVLENRLADAYPDKHIEVINVAVTAINSYTLADRIDEILEQQPDAILIYAGHNEFYGALGAGAYGGMGNVHSLKKLHLYMLRYSFYQGIRTLVDGISGGGVPELEAESQQVATLMERITRNRNIEYQSRIYQKAHRHFELNMENVLRRAKVENVPVFIGDLVSNIGDLEPFVKEENGEKSQAMIAFEQAEQLLQQGFADSARVLFAHARDLDGIRFRASGEINGIIKELSKK
ncbi:MAG: SGNH/GDSL hydrolase family protein, partial [Bacteroidota bacterium]